jgi:hypothetical protein
MKVQRAIANLEGLGFERTGDKRVSSGDKEVGTIYGLEGVRSFVDVDLSLKNL